jgi:hypothetical protein
MQSAEKRKAVRRMLTYPAWINLGDGSPVQECSLCDASQRGAQLAVADPDSIPDRFVLALSADGAATRQCRVVWRTGNQIGVEFVKAPANPGKKTGFKARATMLSSGGGAETVSLPLTDPSDADTPSKD